MRIRLDIAYDGTHFRGWARQPDLRTVQGTVEGALERILGGTASLVVAGRTDAGVHATGQVAHVDLAANQVARLRRSRVGVAGAADRHPGAPTAAPDATVPASAPDPTAATLPPDLTVPASAPDPTAATLPSDLTVPASAPDPGLAAAAARLAARVRGVVGSYSDVAVHHSSVAPEGFDARFSAVWRRYSYRISDTVTGYDPLERHRTTTVRAALDEQAMDAAARSLIGLHDFAAYCKPREMATTIRTLLEFDWRRDAEGVLVANVKADAFCHSMVRALVGACVAVGQGRLDVDDVRDIRDEGLRTSDFTVIAARGLTLTEVGYPSDELLARRAEQTRARRDLE
ncbi:tRNA pseudouridine(38-40) synthase TruA [Microbacterium sp. zg.B48]|uniref:tRNA pseudouridine(38-40) synthase TruA n=1 Tax=Microbacterium sp. zg.B48 TaxID=2969408 RepID=UPI00214BE21B|nr:tRNA pseudouridine(38-40) synthase TruA [Microbacterium sp. zg.B48]MCR2763270.1 tRNA pseudouridine(38-40) synthase TruA [Microbacterium sp. zg.B48]